MAVTVLVSIPIVVEKYLDKRSSRKEERTYFGSQSEGSMRHHEAVEFFLATYGIGATELYIQMEKR